MKISEYRRVCIALVIIYGCLHFLFYMYNLMSVPIEYREFTKKELSEGPLVRRENAKGRSDAKILSGIFIMNAKNAFDQPLSDSSFKTRKPFNSSAPLPKIPDEFAKTLITVSKQIIAKHKHFVYFTFVNSAYGDLTMNWLCNAALFPKNLERTIVVSTSQNLCTRIRKEWKQVTCIRLFLGPDYEEGFEWGRQQYINILALRAKLLLRLVKSHIPFMLFETDAVWFRDPLPFFIQQDLIDDADIVIPVKGYQHKGQKLSFDPMLVYPTNGSIALFEKLDAELSQDKKAYDQDILEDLCKSQFNGVVCREFQWNDIADGKWFKLSENERKRFRPYIVNNNYYVGVENKVARQAINGLWLLTKKGLCTTTKAKKMIGKYGGNTKKNEKH